MVSMLLAVSFLAPARSEDKETDKFIIYQIGNLYGVKGVDGAVLTEAKYKEIAGFFLSDDHYYSRVLGDKGLGIIDETGKEIAPCIYDSVLGPSEGYYVATGWNDLANGFETQFYTVEGEATGWFFDTAWEFHDGWAVVAKDGVSYLLDKQGTLTSIAPYDFAWGDGFHEGMLLVKKDGLYGYLNTALDIAVECKYKDADSWYINGQAEVQTKDGEWIVIDKRGNKIGDIPNP